MVPWGHAGLEWFVSKHPKIQSSNVIATAYKHSPQQIAFNEVGRQAIMSDLDWMVGVITARLSLPRDWL